MSQDYIDLTAAEMAEDVRAGKRSAKDNVRAALTRIDSHDGQWNAFTDVTAERALAAAEAVDLAVGEGRDPGPLAGVPFAVKNLVDIEGVVTRAGSKVKRAGPAAGRDAVSVSRLEKAGAILMGGLNMGEFAYDFTGENEHDGPSRNPRDPVRMTGGSSGGSGAAVAGGLVPLAVGSDTNGSIRVPPSWCGIYGLKPTYGRVPMTGAFPFVDSLDHLGPMGRSPADLALALAAMQGADAADPRSQDRPPCEALGAIGLGAEGLRIAVAGGYFADDGPAGEAVARCAEHLGASDQVEIAGADAARAAAYVITNVEGATLHYDGIRSRPADYGDAIRERLMAGAMLPGIAYVKAQRIRRAFAAEMVEIFSRWDAILAPATPFPAVEIGRQTIPFQGRDQAFRPHIGLYTQPISFVGLPVVAVPVHGLDPLPLGVQIIAPAWREDVALRIADALHAGGVTSAPPAGTEGTT